MDIRLSVASGEQCEHAVQLVPKKRELERRDVGPLDVIMEDEEFEEEIVPTEETILPVEETIELCTESRSSGSDFEVQVKVLQEHDEEWENVASSRIEWARRLRQNRTVDSESLLSHPVSDSVRCIKLNGLLRRQDFCCDKLSTEGQHFTREESRGHKSRGVAETKCNQWQLDCAFAQFWSSAFIVPVVIRLVLCYWID